MVAENIRCSKQMLLAEAAESQLTCKALLTADTCSQNKAPIVSARAHHSD
jgi:hypothetical protein